MKMTTACCPNCYEDDLPQTVVATTKGIGNTTSVNRRAYNVKPTKKADR